MDIQAKKELIELFNQMLKSKDDKSQKAYFKRLYESEFLVPIQNNDEEPGRKIISILESADKRKFIPAFLDEDANSGRFPEDSLERMDYKTLKYIVIDSGNVLEGIVLNPFGENIILDRKNIKAVDNKMLGMSIKTEKASGKVKLSKPKNTPERLIMDLKQCFDQSIQVEKAWLLIAENVEKHNPHPMVLIDFYGSKFDLFPKVADIVKKYMQQGQTFELVQKNESFDVTALGETMIYSRENKGLLC